MSLENSWKSIDLGMSLSAYYLVRCISMILLINSMLKLWYVPESVFKIAQLEGRKIQEELQLSIRNIKA